MGRRGRERVLTALRGRAPRRGRRRALSVAAQCGRRAKARERRLLLAGRREETGLPADADVRVVAQHEPDHQVDPRIGPGDRVATARTYAACCAQGTRRRPDRADSSATPYSVIQIRFFPQSLLTRAISLLMFPSCHRVATGLRCRRLARAAVVRMVRVSVEIPQPGTFGQRHEGEGRQGRPRRTRVRCCRAGRSRRRRPSRRRSW